MGIPEFGISNLRPGAIPLKFEIRRSEIRDRSRRWNPQLDELIVPGLKDSPG